MRTHEELLSLIKLPPFWSKVETIVLIICLFVSFVVSCFFHNRFWWGPDDGYFGYIAQQILNGEVLHKDIKVVHSGLNYLINAMSLKFSDGDLVGLRYPLVVLAVVQTGFAYKIAEKHGALVSVAAASMALAFSFIQWINPTPNWYTLCLAFIALFVVTQRDPTKTKAILLLGFIVGTVFLLRQLTGVLLAVGISVAILLKNSEAHSNGNMNGGKVIILLLALVLGVYVFKAAKLTGLMLFGIWPLFILLFCAQKCSLGWKRTFEILGLLIAGSAISAIPLCIYYGINGSIDKWLYGMLISPLNFIDQPLFKTPTVFTIPGVGLKELLAGNVAAVPGLTFWLSLIFAPMVLGIVVIRKLYNERADIPIIGIVASVYSLVAIHYEDMTYLMFCIAIVFVALLSLIENRKLQKGYAIAGICISSVAIFAHAGQPMQRTYAKISTNARLHYDPAVIPNTSIIVPEEEARQYRDALNIIERCSNLTDSIYAFPINPELYFLSGRESSFDFVVSFVGLATEDDVDRNLRIISSENAPVLIFHAEERQSNSRIALELLEKAQPFYISVGKLSEWTIYQHRIRHETSPCLITPNNNN